MVETRPTPASKPLAPKPTQTRSRMFGKPALLQNSADPDPLQSALVKPKNSNKKWWLAAACAGVGLLIVGIIVSIWWYNDGLRPRSATESRIRLVVPPGATIETIARDLQQKKIIKNAFVFELLAKQNGKHNKLQAGSYLFSPTQSPAEILDSLAQGKVDSYNVTIVPGQTLADIKQKFLKAGFTAADIDAAFAKTYNHPLLVDKPKDVNLDGYIFPETYQINSQTTVEQLLERSFDEFYKRIEAKNLRPALVARGFNLHQGITLASIIQKEASTSGDRRQVAQVFELRLQKDMVLGSDVTFMYAATLLGQPASPDINSPYNTRKSKGLPPGGIANFSLDALQAVADPAAGDYLYFVAGDDGTMHFAQTFDEHDANVKKYCTKLCSKD